MISGTLARAFALFVMLIGPVGLANAGDLQPTPQSVSELQLQRLHRITVDYAVTGMPEELEDCTWDEWVEYRDSLSDEDQEILKSQMTVTATTTFKDATITVSSDGSLTVDNDLGTATGEVQFVNDKGLVTVLRNEGSARADWVWPGERSDNFLSLETEENGEVYALQVKQTRQDDGVWYGSRTFTISSRVKDTSVVGADLQVGDGLRWSPIAWITGTAGGLVTVAVGAAASVAYAAKCAKDALWDAYDCSPGTIACRCNGCTSC